MPWLGGDSRGIPLTPKNQTAGLRPRPITRTRAITTKKFKACLHQEDAFRHASPCVFESAPVAQLDRALASGAKGQAFESPRAYQFLQTLSAFTLGPQL